MGNSHGLNLLVGFCWNLGKWWNSQLRFHISRITQMSPKEELCNICLLIYVSNTKHPKWLISLWQNLENDALSPLLSGIPNYTDWPRGKLLFKIKWQICCRLVQMGTFWGTTCLLLLSSTNVLFWGWIFLPHYRIWKFRITWFGGCKHLSTHFEHHSTVRYNNY